MGLEGGIGATPKVEPGWGWGEGQQADNLTGKLGPLWAPQHLALGSEHSHRKNTGCEAAVGGAVSWLAMVLRGYLWSSSLECQKREFLFP